MEINGNLRTARKPFSRSSQFIFFSSLFNAFLTGSRTRHINFWRILSSCRSLFRRRRRSLTVEYIAFPVRWFFSDSKWFALRDVFDFFLSSLVEKSWKKPSGFMTKKVKVIYRWRKWRFEVNILTGTSAPFILYRQWIHPDILLERNLGRTRRLLVNGSTEW